MQIGLIGCGWVGSLRVAALARLPEFRLTAVSDENLDRARTAASVSGAGVEADWRSLVQRRDVDAVLISTPPPFHVEMGIRALECRKHVLCEKPLARNPAECLAILRAAEQSSSLLATGFNIRFFPAITQAREILESGVIGELDHIRSYAGHPGGREFTHEWNHDAATMGGGTLFDNGIHVIDLTRYFLGEVSEVKGYATGNVWSFPDCEDNGFALLKNPDGRIAILQASWSEWRGYRFAVEIYGTRGCVRASYPPMWTEVVYVNGAGDHRHRKRYFFPWLQIVERLRSYRWTLIQSFTKELRAFAAASRGEKTSLALGFDGLRAVQIAHAVYQSAATSSAVRLDG